MWFEVFTPCDTSAWMHAGEVVFTPAKTKPASGMAEAVVVIDPGHGGPNRGATGPTGLPEAEVDLDIARRLRDLLLESHDVDWASGRVGIGTGIPAVRQVWMTRVEGPPGADFEAGLLFRSRLAESAGADLMISIHNNADPDGPFEGPGSEAFYSIADPASRRLAGLIVEEFRRGLFRFEAGWVGDTDAGAKYRLREDGRDYYGLLRNARVPTVIAEGAFISNPDEENLLRTPDFRQAYAEAAYRAIVRFLTTDDPGSGFTDPYPRTVPAGSGAPLPSCAVPSQP
jgi:N-acetylmuramoyl-L-alanine amidase